MLGNVEMAVFEFRLIPALTGNAHNRENDRDQHTVDPRAYGECYVKIKEGGDLIG